MKREHAEDRMLSFGFEADRSVDGGADRDLLVALVVRLAPLGDHTNDLRLLWLGARDDLDLVEVQDAQAGIVQSLHRDAPYLIVIAAPCRVVTVWPPLVGRRGSVQP